MKASDKVDKAIIRLLQTDEPFFATVIMSQERIETRDVPTMAVDGVSKFYYNPDFVDTLTFDEVKGVVVHEIEHIINKHSLRKQGRNHNKFNRACDYAINLHVLEQGYVLPKGGLVDAQYKDMTPEQIYAALPDDPEDGKGKSGEGEGNGDPGGCGGFVDPKSPDRKDKDGNPAPMNEEELEEAEREVDKNLRTALTVAEKAGKLSAELARRIRADLEAKVDWREVLSRFVCERSQDDYSYARPSTRYIATGAIMPSRFSESFGTVCLLMDTSASISNDLLSQAASELLACLELYELVKEDPTLTCIYCDSAVAGVEVLEPGDTPEPKGGGGTRFSPAFAKMKELEEDFCGAVYITDGHCNDFGPEPEIPVLWALTIDNKHFNPPFGEVMRLGE